MRYSINSSSYQQSIEKILELSDTMLTRASNNEWEAVEELEKKRNVILENMPAPENTNVEIESAIQQIIETNESLVSMGSSELKKCISEVTRMKKNKKGISVYESIHPWR